ncbi:hypothetical protein FRC16_004632 [Serendipita sp. 398]|nr:hypothetical protein FRC16_004632 [Serendipita sp. 398]
MSFLVNKARSNSAKQQNQAQQERRRRAKEAVKFVKQSYTSNEVDIPHDFLVSIPPDAKPVVTYPIDFKETLLPEYEGCYAVVLDHVLTPGECKQLIKYAEMSAASAEEAGEGINDGQSPELEDNEKTATSRGWTPALVNAGKNGEVMIKEYRNSDRIIWDCQEIVDRIWERCLAGGQEEFVRSRLGVIMDQRRPFATSDNKDEGENGMDNKTSRAEPQWRMKRLNERMRFLRYGQGQYFHEHCDGTYSTPDGLERSFVTLHLYLNDSIQALTPRSNTPASVSFPPPLPDPEAEMPELEGGATPFFSRNLKRRLDVDPKAGRVLLFQHKDLFHSGDYVTAGVKYTMRTDLMYERGQ